MTGKNRTTVKNDRNLLPIETIIGVTEADSHALEKVLNHYRRQIDYLSLRSLFDQYGNAYVGIDHGTRDYIESNFITAVMNFKI